MSRMEEKKKSRLPLIAIILFVIVLVALYAYLYILPGIKDSRADTSVVYYTRVQDQKKSQCVVVRKEEVVTSGGAGSVSYFAEEGVKARKRTKIADVYSGTQRDSLTAPATGFLSFYLDGYEAELDPDMFPDMDITAIAGTKYEEPKSEKPDSVDGDVPLFKIVSSDVWYVLIIQPLASASEYSLGSSLSIEFPDGTLVPAAVDSFREDGEYRAFLASVSRYYDKSAQIRSFEGNVISSVYEGLMIPTDSIATNGENIGVYVVGLDGEYTFKPIEIIIRTPNGILIQDGGSVKQYDEVLNDARNYTQQN